MSPRSSGDRASASGAEGRRFESCRGHQHRHFHTRVQVRGVSSVLEVAWVPKFVGRRLRRFLTDRRGGGSYGLERFGARGGVECIQ